MSQSDQSDVEGVTSDSGLDLVRKRALIAGAGAWVLAIALVVSAVVVGGAEAGTPDPGPTTTTWITVPPDSIVPEPDPDSTLDSVPETEPGPIVPADFREAELGINACEVSDCANTLSTTITPPVVVLDAPLGEVTFTINFENTARADADGNGTGYFISAITLDDGFVPVENKSDCPTVSDRLPLRASEVKSCTMVARGTREDYGFSNDPLDVGVRATLYMLGSNWTAGDPESYPVTLRSASVDVPK